MSFLYEARSTFATALDEEFTQGQTTMVVKNISDKYIPVATDDEPQLLTILDESNEIIETIKYTGKDLETNEITGITREIEVVGFESTGEGKPSWGEGTVVGRYHTAYEQNLIELGLSKYKALINALLDIDEGIISYDEPSGPEDGDLWFNLNDNKLYEYDSSIPGWVEKSMSGRGGTIISDTEPDPADEGVSWFDLSDGELKIYRDGIWETVALMEGLDKLQGFINSLFDVDKSTISSSEPSNPSHGDLWFNYEADELKSYNSSTSSWDILDFGLGGIVRVDILPDNPSYGKFVYHIPEGEYKIYQDEWHTISTDIEDKDAFVLPVGTDKYAT